MSRLVLDYNNMLSPRLGSRSIDPARLDAITNRFKAAHAEVGVGLRWAISPHFHLTADIRGGSRSTVANDSVQPGGTAVRSVTPPTTDSGASEDYTRGRLAAILYF